MVNTYVQPPCPPIIITLQHTVFPAAPSLQLIAEHQLRHSSEANENPIANEIHGKYFESEQYNSHTDMKISSKPVSPSSNIIVFGRQHGYQT